MGFHSTTILGRLGKDPEMKYTATGTAVATFSVAVGTKYGEKEETEWYSVVVWDKLAETCAQYLAKGREVLIVGEMKTRSWAGQDGTKQYRTELVGRTVQFVGSKPAAAGNAPAPGDLPFDN